MTVGTPDRQVASVVHAFADYAFLWTSHESLSLLERFSFL